MWTGVLQTKGVILRKHQGAKSTTNGRVGVGPELGRDLSRASRGYGVPKILDIQICAFCSISMAFTPIAHPAREFGCHPRKIIEILYTYLHVLEHFYYKKVLHLSQLVASNALLCAYQPCIVHTWEGDGATARIPSAHEVTPCCKVVDLSQSCCIFLVERCRPNSGGARNCHLGAIINPESLGDGNAVQGQSPCGRSGDGAEAVCRHCLHIFTAETTNI